MMMPRPNSRLPLGFATLFTFVLALTAVAQEPGAPPPGEKAPEELTRGPVHEAFGKPITFNPKPGLKIPKAPPAAIEELPPEEKPEGDNVAWIPGYWSYDDDREDFIWVSGFWRTLPPERTWVSGYWKEEGDGHTWVSGYWAAAQTKETEYLPPPPESLEVGASTKPPTEDHVWVPGCWVWQGTRYAWRPGYWLVSQPDWIWVPAHYVWTPCGYVFVDGYWDHTVRRRGVLFAPVYVDRVVYTRPGFVYSPAVVIDADVVTDHFFVRASYGHYYFGDYYATTYTSVGITPWFSFHATRYSYDPIYSYYECHYRRVDPGWAVRVQVNYGYRVNHVDARPPRTFVQQQVVVNNVTNVTNVNKTVINNKNGNNRPPALGRSLKEVAQDKDAPTKFQKVEPEKRKQITQEAKEVRLATAQRTKLEGEAAKNAPKDGKAQPLRLERPATPVVARGNDDDKGKGKAPPPLPPSAKQDREKLVQRNKGTGDNAAKGSQQGDAKGGGDKARASSGQDEKNRNNQQRSDDKSRTASRQNDQHKGNQQRNDDKTRSGVGQGNKNNAGGNKPPAKLPPKPPAKTPPKSDKDGKKDKN